jgi:hypothetical protein
MRRVSERSENPLTDRQDCEAHRRDRAAEFAEKALPDREYDQGRRGVDERQADVNPPRRLSENRHDQRVRVVRAGELHVVRDRVRRDAFQDQPPRVRVLPLVPFQRDIGDAKPDVRDEGHRGDDREERPGRRGLRLGSLSVPHEGGSIRAMGVILGAV